MNWKTLIAAALIAAPTADAALIAAWNQDEFAGPIIDSTGNHPEGVPVGFPIYSTPGVPNGSYGAINVSNAFGTSIEYGPTIEDDFFIVGSDNLNPVMNLESTGSFTVMGWMNPNAQVDALARSYKILSTGSGTGADRGWGLALRLPTNFGTTASIRFTNFGILDNDSQTFNVTFGSWIHIAATYNNGLITYFLNGTMLDTDTSSFGPDTINSRLVVGSRLGGNDADQMNGMLDGIRVYDQVLSDTEIQQAAAESVSAVPEPSVAMLALCGLVASVRRSRRGE
jgi:hypothetical protein